MTNTSVWKVVISGALALVCISLVQGFWLKNSMDLSVRTFDEKVRIALRNVASSLSVMSQVQLPSYHLINQISQEYYVVNIRDAIDANSLEFYLSKEIEAVHLQTDFEYGIYDCNTDQMVYGNYIQTKEGKTNKIRSTNLPTYDEFVYYFGVRFPNRRGYLLTNQWLPLLFTGILVLAMIFFIYATYEIFHQKKLSELQKDFINNMTHEFKTPLTSIKVSSEVFLKDPAITEDPRLKRYAKIIQEQTSRLDRQVERVLQIADVSANALDLKMAPVNLHELIRHVVDQLKSRLDHAGGVVTLDLKAPDDQLKADRLHLANVLFNLMDNALKYSKPDPRITIQTHQRGNVLELSVMDNGIGIDEKHLAKLGKKFFRVPTGDIHNTKGFGLGLHYVQQIVKSHGWKMHLESTPKVGTTVSIDIKKIA